MRAVRRNVRQAFGSRTFLAPPLIRVPFIPRSAAGSYFSAVEICGREQPEAAEIPGVAIAVVVDSVAGRVSDAKLRTEVSPPAEILFLRGPYGTFDYAYPDLHVFRRSGGTQ